MSFEGYVNLQNEQIIADRNKERLKNKNTKFLSNEVSIEFKNIFLSYGSQEVHKNLSFKIQKKEFVGIFGPSGSGKSTIVDLICGLLSPQKGKILINGFDIDNINIRKWRESIGYITQSVYLIDGSIKENISFNRENISNDKILNVLKLVGADLFVNKKEKKLSTKINLRTSNLSGGEKQRIGIARGLLGDKSLLIFDEPTSSLDSVNEKKIISIIKKLKGKKTIILISHDLKVMKFCDKIIKI
jgi:ABC-type multidrug transport system fused ATPase/permease subunit